MGKSTPPDLRRAGLISSALGLVFIGVMAAAILWLGSAVLQEPKKTLVVLVTPPGAVVKVDGVERKDSLRLLPGSHRVEVSAPGAAIFQF